MPYDLSKLKINPETGMVKTGLYSEVDPNALSEAGYEQAFAYASPDFQRGVERGEPVVLSSAAGKNAFESKVQPVINRANQNLLASQERAKATEKALADTKDILPEEIIDEMRADETPEQTSYRVQKESFDRQMNEAKNIFDQSITLSTNTAQAEKNLLQSQWNQRKSELERANKGNLATWKQSFIRAGVSEYSPEIGSDLLTFKEKEGIQRLQELDTQYASLIGRVNAALEQNKFTAAANYSKSLADLEEKANELLADTIKEATETNKKIRERQIQASRDATIANLLEQGMTDPSQMMTLLNEAAVASGFESGDFTAEEIGKTLKSLTDGKKDWQDKLSGTTRDFFILKGQGLLPESIASLPEGAQMMAYLKLQKTVSGIGSGDKITISEAKTLGLPFSTIGMSQDEIIQSLKGNEPPAWFVEKAQNELGMSLTPEASRGAWKEYREEKIAKAEGAEVSEDANYKKARQYFEATYDGLTEENLDQLASQVMTYVNGGMSYADAIQEVISELE